MKIKVLEGFLKFAIKVVSMPNNTSISQGCVADLEMKHKIEIRFKKIQESDIAVGQHIRIKGVIQHSARPYLLVNDITDIEPASDMKKSQLQMCKASSVPVRIKPLMVCILVYMYYIYL